MGPSSNDTEVTVIGAGLSGLAAALLLREAGRSVRILEAAAQPGGRIRSVFQDETNEYLADLGPTWVWPAWQPIIARWLDKLDLQTFPQINAGDAILDYGPGTTPEIRQLPDQDGNLRIVGGPQALIDALLARLPDNMLETACPVTAVSMTAEDMKVEINGTGGSTQTSGHVVVAVPPRIALSWIGWTPGLPEPLRDALGMMPTWMAPQAKVVALYDKPFWRDRGLSGRIASQGGPIVEAHDHCGPDGANAAIFGFIGWPHDMRSEVGAELDAQVRAQLKRCFGADSPEPRSIHIEDWALDPHIASQKDLEEPMSHPDVGPDVLRQPHADGRLWFAGAEVARQSPGLIDGALEAAEHVAASIARACSGQ